MAAPPLVVGAVWFAVWLGRLAVGRGRRRDIAPLTFLYVNTLYIYMFAEGSSVHLYRVFFYSGFFALAVADLASDAWAAAHRLAYSRARRTPDWIPAVAAGALVAAYFVAVVPHAWHNLLESRVLMGTHGEPHYSPEQQKLRFAAEVHARTTKDERVIIHYPHLGARKEFWYYIDRNYDEIQSLAQLDKLKPTLGKSVLILDERLLSVADRPIYERLIAAHPVTYFESFTMVDLRSSTPGAQSFAFQPAPMSLAYRWFISHKYPPLVLVRRAYLPGECSRARARRPRRRQRGARGADRRAPLALLPQPARRPRADGAGAGRRHRDRQAADDPRSRRSARRASSPPACARASSTWRSPPAAPRPASCAISSRATARSWRCSRPRWRCRSARTGRRATCTSTTSICRPGAGTSKRSSSIRRLAPDTR